MTPARQVEAWLTRLAGEHHASVHTVAGYRRDLDKLLRFMAAGQVDAFEALDGARMRAFIAAEHRAGLAPKSLQPLYPPAAACSANSAAKGS
ncbi:Tyrosine recombinase XerC OS=Rhodanobacter lindaniclasticus OX=75310 GN=xerC PE=3 SV=1 [Rhodanobacter lindaniclasticus]